MQLSKERIYYLLKSYTDGDATEAEEKELFQWVAETPDDTAIRRQVQKLVEQHKEDKFLEVDWDKIYRQIQGKTANDRKNPTGRENNIWQRVAAAILILILGGGAIYWFSTQNNQAGQTPAIVKNLPASYNAIKPGTTKAILKAGASSVSLSSTDTSFTLSGNQVHIKNGDVQIAEVKPVEYTLMVPRGGTYSIVLADGTKVWLNADSKLIYPSVFTGDHREVTLEGEAYFDVKTDADHPFIVKLSPSSSNKGKVKVLGTEFNVQAYPDEKEVRTTLVNGKVMVGNTNKNIILKPGQQSLTDKDGALKVNAHPDIEQVVAWKNGYFRFDKVNIHTIMKKLARWYDIKVSYSEKVPTQLFGAIMSRDNNIYRILKMLEATGDVHFKVEGREVLVMP